jgi:hypothetical protein
MAGESKHGVRRLDWRVRKASGDDSAVRQAVCGTTLDDAVRRYGLPQPNHLRLGPSASATDVFAGASKVLELESLKTILFTPPLEQVEPLAAALAARRWVVTHQIELPRGRAHVQLQKH